MKSTRDRLVEYVQTGAMLDTKKQAGAAVDAMITFIRSEVASGSGEVKLGGFGRFFKKTRPERTFRIPGKPGESKVSPKHDVALFKAYRDFLDGPSVG